MRISVTTQIKGKTLPEWMICLLLVLPFLFAALNELFWLPRLIRYAADVAWVLLLVLMWFGRRQIQLSGPTRKLALWAVAFLACTALLYLTKYQSALYYLWGVRNNFRFYAAFVAFAVFLTAEDAQEYWKLFDRLFWVNAAVSLVQFFWLDRKGDYLGGIFGVQRGSNGYTNLFFVIILTRTLVLYLEKKEKTGPALAKFAAMLVIAVLAELKFFFIEALAILALAVLMTGVSRRKLWIALGGAAALFAGAVVISLIFPHFDQWFSIQNILKYAHSDRGYTAAGDLNRLNAITQINGRWLTSTGLRLFGLGLGNCETSTYSFLNTPFFKENGHMHYNWFSHMHMYLECGWLGLVFTAGFFVLVVFFANKNRGSGSDVIRTHSTVAMILSILCVVNLIYNNSLRTEAGYMMYFALALPFVREADPSQCVPERRGTKKRARRTRRKPRTGTRRANRVGKQTG